MRYDRLTTGLAVVLGTLTVVLTVVALLRNLAVLFLAAMFGLSTYLVYYHASGRMADRVYERVERRARVDGGRGRRGAERRRKAARRATRGRRSGGGGRRAGAGPREDWTPPRDGATAREAAAGGRVRGGRGRGGRGRGARAGAGGQRQRRRAPSANDGPTPAEAYRTLGLDPGADEAAVKSAYRQRVKEVHPDADGGDEDEFMAVKEAYETLTD
ncbi:J domain-containing protein [Halomicrobium salinisoli]|uniref:J domain-containing protein n=1 Tax=Halomicrobium salinisoli TaxID=2878391 RepID=UPI001CF06ADB|nr:J domain-containing protein [Halomicrobium salinisoli]